VKVWVEVSEERLAANLRVLQRAAGEGTELLAVVKANAYGHGADRCSVMLARAGAKWFGVTCVDEGALVRRALDAAGFHGPQILVMCGLLPEDVPRLAEYRLIPVLWTTEQVAWLARAELRVGVHIEVDTGMGRQGVLPGPELDQLLAAIDRAELRIDGVFTHFCGSEVANSELTQTQEQRFEAAIGQFSSTNRQISWLHAGNSSTLDNPARHWPWLLSLAKTIGARPMVRSGLALYGYCLEIDGPAASQVRAALQPVMQWKTRVLSVRELAEGETVGYGATFTAPRAMRVALLPVGYADGLRRELSSTNAKPGGWAMIANQPAPFVGRISMNLTVVDVTGIDDVKTGDEVVLLGDGITAEDHATLAGTVAYEIVCAVRER